MKMYNSFRLLFGIALVITGFSFCKEKGDESIVVQSLNITGSEAMGPYFTQDNNGNQVLCWTEKDSQDSLYVLKYSVYNPDSVSFGLPVSVSVSKGMSTSPESAAKVAFKPDGTVIAVFAKRFENEKNPFAGAIYYSRSTDNGKNWSKAQYLHSDTSHTYGRSFFDLTNLKNGEIGAIWLDGRYGKAIKGSSLFFATTKKDMGFDTDRCIAKGTCECCRTDIISDNAGNIHIAYRSILFPKGPFAKQVRDMVYSVSTDNGDTFTEPQIISKDNWQIEGCPHSGPSVAINGKTVNAVWFTAGGNTGIYFTSSPGFKSDFNRRTLLTSSGRHPQITTFDDGNLAVVCEELEQAQPEHSMKKASDHSSMGSHHSKAANAKVVLRIFKNSNDVRTISLTDANQPEHHPVITSMGTDILTAWIREENGKSKIQYSLIKGNW